MVLVGENPVTKSQRQLVFLAVDCILDPVKRIWRHVPSPYGISVWSAKANWCRRETHFELGTMTNLLAGS